MQKGYIFFLVFFCCYAAGLQAQNPIEITPSFSLQKFTNADVLFFKDSAFHSLDIQEITQHEFQQKFKPVSQETLNFGFSHDSHWLKFTLHRKQTPFGIYLLEVGYPLLDSLTLYIPQKDSTWQAVHTGDRYPFSKRRFDHRNFIFLLDLPNDEPQTYYLKFRSNGPLLAPIQLHSMFSFRVHQVKTESFYAMFYGIMAIMLAYNLFLYFTLRNSSYFWYCLTILLDAIAQANERGHLIQFVWGDSIWWANHSIPFFLNMAYMSILFFGASFLNLKKYHKPTYYLFITLIGFIGIINVLVLTILPYGISARLITIITLLTPTLMLITGIFSLVKKNRSARFYTLAWSVYLVALIVVGLRSFGLVPNSTLVHHGVQIGTMIEVLFLSFALADKINFYRRKTEEAQALALSKSEENALLIREQNTLLEQKVQEKTKVLQEVNQELLVNNNELEQIQEELIVNNEELKQTQEEIVAQRDLLALNNKELQAYQTRISQNIQAAKLIQKAILPTSNKIDDFFTDHFILYRPKDVVSGDFYWMEKHQNHIIFIEADCTGHGVSGAFMTLIGNSIFDHVIRIHDTLHPVEILTKTHLKIEEVLHQKQTKNHDGMDLTVLVITQTEQGFDIQLSSAGQKFYYTENQTLHLVEGSRKKVGGTFKADHQRFEVHHLSLPQGSNLYLASDGFSDQNDSRRVRFGSIQFFALLEKVQNLPLAEQKQKITEALKAHQQSEEQRDDITVIGLKL